MFYLFLLAFAGQDRFEKEYTQHNEKQEQFQENKKPQCAPPCHGTKTIYIEAHHGFKTRKLTTHKKSVFLFR